jgi:FlaA1/EpsC-like NDP-sugar epimerase
MGYLVYLGANDAQKREAMSATPKGTHLADGASSGDGALAGVRRLFRLNGRRIGTMSVDVAIVLLSYYLVLNFRFAGSLSDWMAWSAGFALFAGIAVVVHVTVNWLTGVYSIVGRYMGLAQAVRLIESGILSFGFLLLVVVVWPLLSTGAGYLAPRTVVIGGSALAVTLMTGIRFAHRVKSEMARQPEQAVERLLLVGAGQAADMLIREIKRTPSLGLQVVGLVDVRREIHHKSIQGRGVIHM